jgi:hypothetical protein
MVGLNRLNEAGEKDRQRRKGKRQDLFLEMCSAGLKMWFLQGLVLGILVILVKPSQGLISPLTTAQSGKFFFKSKKLKRKKPFSNQIFSHA